jgi:hypothetical protein
MLKLTAIQKEGFEAKLEKSWEISERNRVCVILVHDEGSYARFAVTDYICL